MSVTETRKGTDSNSRSTANDKGLLFWELASGGEVPKRRTGASIPVGRSPRSFGLSKPNGNFLFNFDKSGVMKTCSPNSSPR